MMKKNIAIVAGGDSGEYEISIRSAEVVEDQLNKDLYAPYLIIIKSKDWSYTAPDGIKFQINKDDFSISSDQGKVNFDAVFIAIHGTPGEDGKLQGYLDMLGIPYTACDHATSALTFNKYFCNSLVSSFGVKVAPSVVFYKGRGADYLKALAITSLPCFVKPNNGGSSVGMSKVNEEAELLPAIEKAFMEDEQVLIEGFLQGREITCGVFKDCGDARSLPITEIKTKNDFFDYEAKYTDGMAEEITPAEVPALIETECRNSSEMLYEKLNCKGFVRFDYIYNESGLYFLEVNTVPGLSPNSIVPQQALADGIPLAELFDNAIDQALRK